MNSNLEYVLLVLLLSYNFLLASLVYLFKMIVRGFQMEDVRGATWNAHVDDALFLANS